jgi:hypothetical protein
MLCAATMMTLSEGSARDAQGWQGRRGAGGAGPPRGAEKERPRRAGGRRAQPGVQRNLMT